MANEVRVLVKADTRQAQQDIDKFSGSVGQGIGTAAKVGAAAVAGLGVASAAGLAASVMAAGDFEAALSNVAAVSGATKAELDGLHDAALRIGKDTAYSATEAAKAMEELAAQGVSAQDIMTGAADATVALAAAGGTDLVTAATAASSAMNIWGLSSRSLTDVVNRLTGAANVSSFGVEDMTLAMAAGGIAASTFKVSMQDTTTALAALAKGGFQSGSDAGTSFKAMISALAAPVGTGAKAMAQLGIDVRDANGEMKPMSGIIDELNRKLGQLTQEDRDAAMAQVFGSDGMRAAGALMKLTGDEFQAMSDTMAATDATEIAATRMDNFKGSMERLKGSIEVVKIEIGEKLLPVLADMADWAAVKLPVAFDFFKTDIMPSISAFATGAAQAIRGFVDFAGPYIVEFGSKAKEQFGKFQEYYASDLKPAFDNIEAAVKYVVDVFIQNWGRISPVLDGFVRVLIGQVQIIKDTLQIVIDLLGGDWAGAWENTKQLLSGIMANWKQIVTLGVDALKAAISIAMTIGHDIIQGLGTGMENAWVLAQLGFSNAWDQVVEGLGDASLWLVDLGWDIIRGLVTGIKDASVNILKAALNEVTDMIPDWKGPPEKDKKLLYDTGRLIIGGLTKGVTDAADDTLQPALAAITQSISDTVSGTLAGLYENVPDYVKQYSPAAGGKLDFKSPSDYTQSYIGGGQYGYMPKTPQKGDWMGTGQAAVQWDGQKWIQGGLVNSSTFYPGMYDRPADGTMLQPVTRVYQTVVDGQVIDERPAPVIVQFVTPDMKVLAEGVIEEMGRSM